jgi:RNA polymerase sigma-54 factor
MAKLSLQLKLGQQLSMTPQLQQAIRLLQMPVMELNAQIQEALEANVMLEQEEPAAADTPDTQNEDDAPEVLQGEEFDTSNWDDTRPSDSSAGNDFQPEYADHSSESLKEHLLWQIDTEDFSPREVVIAQALVDCINDDGYLTDSLENIAQALPQEAGFSTAEIEMVLSKLQTLDPIGVGARDLAECVRLQLQQLDPTEPGVTLALRIAKSALERVADNELAMLRRELGVSETDLDDALTLIRACHPKPGSAISQDTAEYVIPDVYVRKQDHRWVVDINRSTSPRLAINQTYASALDNSEGYSTLRSQLQEARFLIRSLEIRNETLTKVAMCIIERQVEFLENGETSMKPMILRDVAEAVDMHESTISRVTTNKYMHTPRGVFEFKYFFSSQLTAVDGSGESSTALRARIKRLIGEEAPEKPLSDSKLAKLLAADGSNIARRTIAKYREAMNIPSSSERKKRAMH